MNDLIVSINNVAVIDTATAVKLAELDKTIKELKDKQDKIKSALLAEMRAKNIRQIKNDILSVTYVFPTDRETFDKDRFKAEHGDLYDEYVSMTPVGDSIRIKING